MRGKKWEYADKPKACVECSKMRKRGRFLSIGFICKRCFEEAK